MKPKYQFISKTLYFPKQKILAIGDLHLGYETHLKEQGILLPFNQLEETKKEVFEIIEKIGKENIEKIVLLGDIRDHFGFHKNDFFEVLGFLRFLEEETDAEIIMIRGNHDTIQKTKHRDFYVEEGIFFTHGCKTHLEMFDKNINMIVIGHIHPAALVRDEAGIKKEKYKTFLVGKFKGKDLIVVPSFFPILEGSDFDKLGGCHSKFGQAIPNQKLNDFTAYVVGDDKVYEFGKFGDLV